MIGDVNPSHIRRPHRKIFKTARDITDKPMKIVQFHRICSKMHSNTHETKVFNETDHNHDWSADKRMNKSRFWEGTSFHYESPCYSTDTLAITSTVLMHIIAHSSEHVTGNTYYTRQNGGWAPQASSLQHICTVRLCAVRMRVVNVIIVFMRHATLFCFGNDVS